MSEHLPQCAWTGVEDDGENVVACDKKASSQVRDHQGHLTYACDEHLAFVESRAGSGDRSAVTRRKGSSYSESGPVHVVLG